MDIELSSQLPQNEIEYAVQLKSNVDLSSAISCSIAFPSSNLSVVVDDNVKSVTKGTAQFEFTDLYRIVNLHFKVMSNANSTNAIKVIKHTPEQNGIKVSAYDGVITIRHQ